MANGGKMSIVLNLTYTDNLSNGYGDLSIDQGADYSKVAFNYPGDVHFWTPKGSIRSDWLQNQTGAPLTIFNFSNLVYNSNTNQTLIQPYILAAHTATIPYLPRRTKPTDSAVPGLNVYVYDIFLSNTSLNAVVKVASGLVEINPEVTA